MVILGIDPGYAIVGYGVIDYVGNHFKVLAYGAVTTEAHTDFTLRLNDIYDGVTALIEKWKPERISIEKLFFNTNNKTAISVAEARGCTVLACVKAGVPVYEYTPLQVKQSITGYGRAEKHQVMEMTRIFLGLDKIPRPDDAADALAMAVCCAHSSGSLLGRLKQ